MNNKILLTNIQRFSLHDGPGIRTTVFLKGCNLRCPWCSNPENLNSYPETFYKDGLEGNYGKYYTPEELVNECLKDKNYYVGELSEPKNWLTVDKENIEKLPGGVTFSGGECLLQMEQLVPVCQALHGEGVHISVETSLFVPEEYIALALEYIDFFYIDMKILNPKRCNEVEKGNIELYLKNIDTVIRAGAKVVIRVPVIGNNTDSEENRREVYKLLKKYKDRILKIELIKEHNLGETKYKSLNREIIYMGVSDELMEIYKNELSDLGVFVEICKV